MDDSALTFDGDPAKNPARATEVTWFSNGDEVLREGEQTPFFFVILSGRVRLVQHGKKIRVLGEQDIFGLENLVFRKPSYYTALAMDRCRVAKYGPEALDHLIRESPRMVQSILMSTLHQLTQTSYFLMDSPNAMMMDVIRVGFFGDGQVIRDQNTRRAEFYRLVSTQGGLRVTMHGREIARIEKPGDFFGCVAGLTELPRQSCITSMGESVVEIYSYGDLDLLIRDYPDTARRIMRAMMLRLADSETGSGAAGRADNSTSGE